MKKVLSSILAIAMIVSTLFCGAAVSAADNVVIDWDVNSNYYTGYATSKDDNGIHLAGNGSQRVVNSWNNDISAYTGLTFTATGTGNLRIEIGGKELSYKTLSSTPTTYTVDFATEGITAATGVEINFQTDMTSYSDNAFDIIISDIIGTTGSSADDTTTTTTTTTQQAPSGDYTNSYSVSTALVSATDKTFNLTYKLDNNTNGITGVGFDVFFDNTQVEFVSASTTQEVFTDDIG